MVRRVVVQKVQSAAMIQTTIKSAIIDKGGCLLCLHSAFGQLASRSELLLDQPRFAACYQFTPRDLADTMFGALNRFIGRLDGEPGQQPRNGPSDNAFGFQIIRNKDPELPLEPWFDFIVGINGHTIVRLQLYVFIWPTSLLIKYPQEDPDPTLFATEVRNCAGSSLTLEIWSAKVLSHNDHFC